MAKSLLCKSRALPKHALYLMNEAKFARAKLFQAYGSLNFGAKKTSYSREQIASNVSVPAPNDGLRLGARCGAWAHYKRRYLRYQRPEVRSKHITSLWRALCVRSYGNGTLDGWFLPDMRVFEVKVVKSGVFFSNVFRFTRGVSQIQVKFVGSPEK